MHRPCGDAIFNLRVKEVAVVTFVLFKLDFKIEPQGIVKHLHAHDPTRYSMRKARAVASYLNCLKANACYVFELLKS